MKESVKLLRCCWLFGLLLVALFAFSSDGLWAQDAVPATESAAPDANAIANGGAPPGEDVPASAARPDVPGFWQSVDSTIVIWSRFVQENLPPVVAWLLLFVFAYVCGLGVFKISFGNNTFGPDAAAKGFWMLSFIMLCGGIFLLPLTWPWWAPLAWVFGLICLTVFLLAVISKRNAR
ncbi:MAG TPA: hypothetical protein VGB77_01200 [Abditibacteriaceae bacterium]|jgi:hypothetical protein